MYLTELLIIYHLHQNKSSITHDCLDHIEKLSLFLITYSIQSRSNQSTILMPWSVCSEKHKARVLSLTWRIRLSRLTRLTPRVSAVVVHTFPASGTYHMAPLKQLPLGMSVPLFCHHIPMLTATGSGGKRACFYKYWFGVIREYFEKIRVYKFLFSLLWHFFVSGIGFRNTSIFPCKPQHYTQPH